jgi:Ulp1 family protease
VDEFEDFSGRCRLESTAVSRSTGAGATKEKLSVKPFGFPDDEFGSVTINTASLHTLKDREHLADDIVDFYLK